jgi:hypothetical protein
LAFSVSITFGFLLVSFGFLYVISAVFPLLRFLAWRWIFGITFPSPAMLYPGLEMSVSGS